MAHSLKFVLPRMIAPEARSRATNGASRLVTLFASARLPAVVGNDGKITSVLWDSAAFNAGATIGSEVVAVNGRKFDGDAIKRAIKAAAGSGPAPELLIHDGDVYRTVKLDWHGGLRYPRLEKVGKGTGTLDALLAPR